MIRATEVRALLLKLAGEAVKGVGPLGVRERLGFQGFPKMEYAYRVF